MRTRRDDGRLTGAPIPHAPRRRSPAPVPDEPDAPDVSQAPEEAESAPEAPEASEAPERRGTEPKSRARARRSGPSRRLVSCVLAAVVVLFALSRTPWVQTVLRQSFSQLPTPYTELYFTSTPAVDGTTLNVPVTIDEHDNASAIVSLKVWLVDDSGKTDAAVTSKLTPEGGVTHTTVSVPVPAAAEVVYVQVAGRPETLHYRFAGVSVPVVTGTP